MRMPLTDLARFVCNGAEQVGRKFTSPDDDWSRLGFIIHRTRGNPRAMQIVLDTGGDRGEFVTGLADVARGLHASAVAVVASTWSVTLPASSALGTVRPSTHPDRFEAVAVTAIDAREHRLWLAKILRDGEQPPVLAPWAETVPGSQGSLGALAIDIIQGALR